MQARAPSPDVLGRHGPPREGISLESVLPLPSLTFPAPSAPHGPTRGSFEDRPPADHPDNGRAAGMVGNEGANSASEAPGPAGTVVRLAHAERRSPLSLPPQQRQLAAAGDEGDGGDDGGNSGGGNGGGGGNNEGRGTAERGDSSYIDHGQTEPPATSARRVSPDEVGAQSPPSPQLAAPPTLSCGPVELPQRPPDTVQRPVVGDHGASTTLDQLPAAVTLPTPASQSAPLPALRTSSHAPPPSPPLLPTPAVSTLTAAPGEGPLASLPSPRYTSPSAMAPPKLLLAAAAAASYIAGSAGLGGGTAAPAGHVHSLPTLRQSPRDPDDDEAYSGNPSARGGHIAVSSGTLIPCETHTVPSAAATTQVTDAGPSQRLPQMPGLSPAPLVRGTCIASSPALAVDATPARPDVPVITQPTRSASPHPMAPLPVVLPAIATFSPARSVPAPAAADETAPSSPLPLLPVTVTAPLPSLPPASDEPLSPPSGTISALPVKAPEDAAAGVTRPSNGTARESRPSRPEHSNELAGAPPRATLSTAPPAQPTPLPPHAPSDASASGAPECPPPAIPVLSLAVPSSRPTSSTGATPAVAARTSPRPKAACPQMAGMSPRVQAPRMELPVPPERTAHSPSSVAEGGGTVPVSPSASETQRTGSTSTATDCTGPAVAAWPHLDALPSIGRPVPPPLAASPSTESSARKRHHHRRRPLSPEHAADTALAPTLAGGSLGGNAPQMRCEAGDVPPADAVTGGAAVSRLAKTVSATTTASAPPAPAATASAPAEPSPPPGVSPPQSASGSSTQAGVSFAQPAAALASVPLLPLPELHPSASPRTPPPAPTTVVPGPPPPPPSGASLLPAPAPHAPAPFGAPSFRAARSRLTPLFRPPALGALPDPAASLALSLSTSGGGLIANLLDGKPGFARPF